MKIRLLLTFVGFAIGLSVPALAQQKDKVDPQIAEQIDALRKKESDAYNNGDAAALAALYTEDAAEVTDRGPANGRQAIEKLHADDLQKVHVSNHLITVDQDSPHIIGTAGNEIWATGGWSETLQGKNFGPIQLKGYWSTIDVREGDTWKIRMLTYNLAAAPAATPSPTTSPSSQ
jgi:ketosteroid isomerase-like protein